MRRHYARYTPEMVERVTGCPRDVFLKVCEALARNSGRERTGAICYAVGWTHHTTGVQIIRAAAILQALLGNVGRPGRRHAGAARPLPASRAAPTSRRSTTCCRATCRSRTHSGRTTTFAEYLEVETDADRLVAQLPEIRRQPAASAWYGDAGHAEQRLGLRLAAAHRRRPLAAADDARDARRRSSRACSSWARTRWSAAATPSWCSAAWRKLDWMVVRDFAETETANFWRDGHLVRDGEMRPEDIGTEVFLMPASLAGEKAGTFTNTHRLMQWHDKVVEAPGDSRSELWFIYHLGRRLKALYADSTARARTGDPGPDLGLSRWDARRRARRPRRCCARSTATPGRTASRSAASAT